MCQEWQITTDTMQMLVHVQVSSTLSVIWPDSTRPTFYSNVKINSNFVGLWHFFPLQVFIVKVFIKMMLGLKKKLKMDVATQRSSTVLFLVFTIPRLDDYRFLSYKMVSLIFKWRWSFFFEIQKYILESKFLYWRN